MLLFAHARGWANGIAREFESLQAMSAVAAREDRLPDLKHVFSDALWMKTRFP